MKLCWSSLIPRKIQLKTLSAIRFCFVYTFSSDFFFFSFFTFYLSYENVSNHPLYIFENKCHDLLKRANVNQKIAHKFECQNSPANKKSAYKPKNRCQIYPKHRTSCITISLIAIHKFKMTVILNSLSSTIFVTNLLITIHLSSRNENKLIQLIRNDSSSLFIFYPTK